MSGGERPVMTPEEGAVRRTAELQLSLLLQLVAFATVFALLMLMAPELAWVIKLLVIALVFLTLKHWGGVIVLILIQADLFAREGKRFAEMSGSWGIVFVLVVLAVLMFVGRYRQMLHQLAKGSVLNLARDLLQRPERPQVDPMADTYYRTMLVNMVSAALRAVVLLLSCTVAARLLLSLVPSQRELQGQLRTLTDIDPTMSVAATLLMSVVAVWLVLTEISWRVLSRTQARIYLRSEFIRLHYSDLRMIVLGRLKLRRGKASRRSSGKPQT